MKSLNIQFTKMHGAGKNYIFLDATRQFPVFDPSELADVISNAFFGVGADGLALIMPSESADLRMRLFNSDGSEVQMCGNAARCVALYAITRGLINSDSFTLETEAGRKSITIHRDDNNNIRTITVDMGKPMFVSPILVSQTDDGHNGAILITDDRAFTVVPVDMGNPHGVVFTDDLSDEAFFTYAPLLEKHSRWPEKANIEFARRINETEYEVRFWIKDFGERPASGTGACAVAAAARLLGNSSPRIKLTLPGGTLTVERNPETGSLVLEGKASFIADGTFYFNTEKLDIHNQSEIISNRIK